jgi:hypothetical protein
MSNIPRECENNEHTTSSDEESDEPISGGFVY